jgi:hypothetical protein
MTVFYLRSPSIEGVLYDVVTAKKKTKAESVDA